jgi:hypothetical protein
VHMLKHATFSSSLTIPLSFLCTFVSLLWPWPHNPSHFVPLFSTLFANPRGTLPPLLPLSLFSWVHGRGMVSCTTTQAHLKLARNPPSLDLPGFPLPLYTSPKTCTSPHTRRPSIQGRARPGNPSRARTDARRTRRLVSFPLPRNHARPLDSPPR